MYHDVKLKDFQKFKRQILYLKQDGWSFIDPNKLNSKKINNLKGKNIILTFDDGFYSNKILTEKILRPMGIKAIYFIPYNFMMMSNKNQALKFIKENLKIKNYKIENLPRLNLNLKDVLDLKKNKHSVGYHSKSHQKLNTLSSEFKLRNEIKLPGNSKFKRIIVNQGFFSFPFGTAKEVNNHTIRIAKQNYKFIFLGIRGKNIKNNLDKKIIFRDNFLVGYNKKMCLSIINGYFDFFYYFQRKKLLN